MLNILPAEEEVYTDFVFIWKECLKVIKDNVSDLTYNTWFLPIKPVSLDGSVLTVQLPSQFFWEWIEEHFNTLINRTIREVLGENGKLNFVINEEKEEIDTVQSSQAAQAPRINIPAKPEFSSNLNPRYTFENFIKGEGNQLASAAAKAISENPGTNSFNPFFIYGGVGLGKTHLIQAIGNKIVSDFPRKKVIYLSADEFTVEFVDAIQSNRRNEFSNFYKNMDALIIDDIQFLVGKEKTQDLFFHIFNNLHQSNKQIILSSDRPPKDLKGLDDRLISRFQWGLSADIQPPDLETRIAILRRKSADYGISISLEVIEYIAKSITSNIRELEGCLIKLLANISLNSKPIDIAFVKRTVQEIATDRKVNITIEHITKTVCGYLKVDENKIRDKTRKKEVVLARQVAMYLSKKLTQNSLKSIGLHFGGRDHSTVIHAVTSIEEAIATDKRMQDLCEMLQSQIEVNSL